MTGTLLYLSLIVTLTSESCLLIPVSRSYTFLFSLRWGHCEIMWLFLHESRQYVPPYIYVTLYSLPLAGGAKAMRITVCAPELVTKRACLLDVGCITGF